MCKVYENGFRGIFDITAIDDEFVKAADVENQIIKYRLDRRSVSDRINNENKN